MLRLLFPVFLLLCMLSTSCSFPTTTPELEGSYILETAGGQSYYLELVRALDRVVYGTLTLHSDTAHFAAPVHLREVPSDSLYLVMWYGARYVSVPWHTGTMSGVGKLGEREVSLSLKKVVDTVSADLTASKQLIPLPLLAEAPAFTAHKRDGRFYTIGWADHQIYLVEETENGWHETPVPYDTSRYTFSSIGLSPDEQVLIAHGGVKDPRPGEENGSIYWMPLADEKTIDSIMLLPPTINTSSYDNFADFTASGNIVYSSWGSPASEAGPGRGDLYRARRTPGGWETALLPGPVNTAEADAGPYMDRRERFVLYHRNRRDPPMKDKLFISGKTPSGWDVGTRLAAPVNLNHSSQYGPRIDQSGTYLYWTSHHRGQGHLYRIPVSDVPALKPFFE